MQYWVMCFMGFLSFTYLCLCVYLLHKAVGGDITMGEAAKVWVPLAACYVLAFMAAAAYPTLAFIPGVAGLVFGIRLLLQQHAAVQEGMDEVLNRDVEKWRQAVLTDDRNAYGHLMLGNALVERRRYDEAISHYRKSLLQDPSYAKDLDLFLGGRKPGEERRVRSRLPDLQQLQRQRRGIGIGPGEGPTQGPWAG